MTGNPLHFLRQICLHREARRAFRQELSSFLWPLGGCLAFVALYSLYTGRPLDRPKLLVTTGALLIFWLVRFYRTLSSAYREYLTRVQSLDTPSAQSPRNLLPPSPPPTEPPSSPLAS